MSEVTITMRQIADAKLCNDNWKDAPLDALGKTEIDDTPVTFRQIVETSGLEDALLVLRCLPERELWRVKLLARICALHVVHIWDAPLVVKEWMRTGSARDACAAWAASTVSAIRNTCAASNTCSTWAAWAACSAWNGWAACAAWDARAACSDELAWQTQELLRIMSLDYSPEALILTMPEG